MRFYSTKGIPIPFNLFLPDVSILFFTFSIVLQNYLLNLMATAFWNRNRVANFPSPTLNAATLNLIAFSNIYWLLITAQYWTSNSMPSCSNSSMISSTAKSSSCKSQTISEILGFSWVLQYSMISSTCWDFGTSLKTHFPLNDAIIVVVEICSSGNKINGRIYQNPCH